VRQQQIDPGLQNPISSRSATQKFVGDVDACRKNGGDAEVDGSITGERIPTSSESPCNELTNEQLTSLLSHVSRQRQFMCL